jgi:hypothetical protein
VIGALEVRFSICVKLWSMESLRCGVASSPAISASLRTCDDTRVQSRCNVRVAASSKCEADYALSTSGIFASRGPALRRSTGPVMALQSDVGNNATASTGLPTGRCPFSFFGVELLNEDESAALVRFIMIDEALR